MRVILTSFSDPIANHLAFARRFCQEMAAYGIEVDPGRIGEPWMSFMEKAEWFNAICQSNAYDWMIDLSGGNLANGMLEWVDFEAFAACRTQFMGFSDLSSLMNALVWKSKKAVFLLPMYYQNRPEDCARLLQDQTGPLTQWHLIIQEPIKMMPRTYGGNLRCFLKLAGTPYYPDLTDATLFLEGNSTSLYELLSGMAQLKQLKAFQLANNVVFGCFTRLYEQQSNAQLEELFAWVMEQLDVQIPFGITRDIGHLENSAGLWLQDPADNYPDADGTL